MSQRIMSLIVVPAKQAGSLVWHLLKSGRHGIVVIEELGVNGAQTTRFVLLFDECLEGSFKC
ncbi:hypothetical protein JTL66_36120, partial [Pseudomonas aeruginosa]|nr:hypothetical protein [Pseudomonas aeruginosa]